MSFMVQLFANEVHDSQKRPSIQIGQQNKTYAYISYLMYFGVSRLWLDDENDNENDDKC